MVSIYIVFGFSVVLAFFVGYTIGIGHSPTTDGYIILDHNDEGDDRITFQLGMEYDDIMDQEEIVFKVIK